MISFNTVTRDASSLLTIDEAKKWLRVEGTDEDGLITAITNGAISYAENYLNKTIGNNTYKMSFEKAEEAFGDPVIKLFRPPVSAVDKIEYVDTDGALQEFDLDKTDFDSDSGYLYLKEGESWPDTASQPFPVRISYTCAGMYSGKEGEDILDAIKLTLTFRYDYRDDPNQRWRKASDNILAPLRIHQFG